MKNMKTFRIKMVGLLATALILFSAFRADKPVVTIFMIGDSTMANKKIDGGNPERGWGMVLPGYFSVYFLVSHCRITYHKDSDDRFVCTKCRKKNKSRCK